MVSYRFLQFGHRLTYLAINFSRLQISNGEVSTNNDTLFTPVEVEEDFVEVIAIDEEDGAVTPFEVSPVIAQSALLYT